MKNCKKTFLSLAFLIFSGLGFSANAQHSASLDDLIEEMQDGLEDLKSYLDSDDFRGKLEYAKSVINDLNEEGDWSGNITIDGETIDLEDSSQPIQDIMEMLGDELNLDIDIQSNQMNGSKNEVKGTINYFMGLMRQPYDEMIRFLRESTPRNGSSKTI